MDLFKAADFEEPNHAHYFKCLKLKRRLDILFKAVGIAVVFVSIGLGLENFFVTFLISFSGADVFAGIFNSLCIIAAGALTAYAFSEKNIKTCAIAAALHLMSALFGFGEISLLFAAATLAMCLACKVYDALENTEGFPYFSTRQVEEEEKQQRENVNEKTLRLMRERDEAESVSKEMPTINFSDFEE